ncbi:EVE domain-containing protein [Leptolyngbya sp. GB1-A1]|uniref:EVE domain-containing protein n=1 Tax=Leptolyngbya sp. GB1-A1 TaxID=2933908 RepID=UPI003297AD8D
MSDRTYWLCLFNPTTWQEFQDAGAEVMGFPETRQGTVRRIKEGDYLLAYMTGISRWFAVLEATSEPYDDLARIWKQALFPCRVKVKAVVEVKPETGIPALSISKDLRMFDNMKTPNWGLLFRLAPRELHRSDGEFIFNALKNVTA